MSGWLWSNVIVGAIEAVAAGVFLSVIGVPGALVWAALTFFAELVPQIGPYLMAVPPILVAFADEPSKALWVALFYIALTQVVGSFVAPIVRSKQMKLHPVSLTFAVLAFGSVFGVLGALIATPLTGFVKAFYDEFYASRLSASASDDESDIQLEVRFWSDSRRSDFVATASEVRAAVVTAFKRDDIGLPEPDKRLVRLQNPDTP